MAAYGSRLTIDTLRAALHGVEPGALLVEPRILRRVIRLDRRLPGLGISVPHQDCYTIQRDRLLAFAERSELEIPPAAELPRTVILLAKPTNPAWAESEPAEALLRRYWRLLFHARVHVDLEKRLSDQLPNAEIAAERRRQIGQAEFAEIREVLVKDNVLFPDPSELETYIEFAAFYLERRYFAESDLPVYFPGVRDWQQIDRTVSQDIYHAQLLEATRLGPAPAWQEPADEAPRRQRIAVPIRLADRKKPSERAALKLRQRAQRARAVGNHVKAAILHQRATAYVTRETDEVQRAAARAELRQLVRRLQDVLQLTADEAAQWNEVLQPLLEPAAQGYWSTEARLLYDLQKVCIEQERGAFTVDIFYWIRKRGKVPARRQLPLLQDVLITKHLRTAHRRLASARLAPGPRDRLTQLLESAVHHVEQESRNRIRPLIVRVLDEVGLVARHLPEKVARQKIVEELLDGVVERGFLKMGDLRDALSKNDLKLADVAGLGELLRGDRLLRADRKLAVALDGVYRPGAIYLRWPQRLSSLAFGTRLGRFATQYIALPFGGAYVALEGLAHLTGPIGGHKPADMALAVEAASAKARHGWPFWALVILLGIFLLFLIHRPAFRAWCLERLAHWWQAIRHIVVEYPARLVRSPLVQRILHSPIYAGVRSYLLRPGLVTALIALPPHLVDRPLGLHLTIDVFLLAALFLNSPIGRYADERVSDYLVRAWHELRMRVFAAVFQWIMDAFQRLMVGLERLLYTVDEWLRFRAGDRRYAEVAKLIAGPIWFFISYVIVFVFTLLVEPQINPIKHFPVVTVSHKLILPAGPMFVKQLAPYIGAAKATTLVWSTIWLIPGVFGFLVWELKENWRLYAANRSPKLVPIPFGEHGESMYRMLRPRFHSGTLPKHFAGLRRATRKAQRTGDTKGVNRKQAALARVQGSIRQFTERELCNLVNQSGMFPHDALHVQQIRLATNRVEIELALHPHQQTVWVVWEEHGGRLTASVMPTDLFARLEPRRRDALVAALAGFIARAGADRMEGLPEGPLATPIAWWKWIRFWSHSAEPQAISGHVVPAASSQSSHLATS